MKKYIKYIIMVIISSLVILFVYNDYFIYKTPIVSIISIEDNKEIGEEYYSQKIKGIIRNGQYKNKEIEFYNNTSISGVFDEQLHTSSEVLVDLSDTGEVNSIINVKRDKYIAILIVLFVDLILITSKLSGFKTLLSLLSNIIISIISIMIFQNNYKTMNLLLLYIVVSIIFIVTSLFITNGKGKKTIAAISSSIISLFISFTLAFFVIKLFGKDLPLWTLNYIEAVYDYENFFYISILLCGLGAIMDISITMSSSINELIEKNNLISTKNLIKSGKEIGKDIVGTMINVMFFTCYAPIIPTVFLAIKNGMQLYNALEFYGQIELIIVLCSCISIVLTIPISLYTSIFIYRKTKGGIK